MKEFKRVTITPDDGCDREALENEGWRLIHTLPRMNEKGVYDMYFERETVDA